MTLMKDLAWVALIVLSLPLIMAVSFVGVVVILARSLYLWAQGNLSSTSRSGPVGVDTPQPASLPAPSPILVPAYSTSGRRLRR
jgi:hypothetical protein